MMRSQFRSTYGQTLSMLERELCQLDARQITIQAGFHRIRNDGWPYSDARPDHPACALQFLDRKGATLVFRAYRYGSFEDNLRAIAMTLEALRAVDRYGVVEGEQYAGFKQIAAPGAYDGTMNHTAALHLLAGLTELKHEQVLADVDEAYRQAAKIAHPDAGGTEERFRLVGEAKRVLKAGA